MPQYLVRFTVYYEEVVDADNPEEVAGSIDLLSADYQGLDIDSVEPYEPVIIRLDRR